MTGQSLNAAVSQVTRRDLCEAACAGIPDDALTPGAVAGWVSALRWALAILDALPGNSVSYLESGNWKHAKAALAKFRGAS